MSATAQFTSFKFDNTSPYLYYDALREQGRVIWDENFLGGAWLLPHFDDVQAALLDSRLSAKRISGWVNRSAPQTRFAFRKFKTDLSKALVFLDDAEHIQLKKIIVHAMRQSMLLAPDLIQQQVTRCFNNIDQDFAQQGSTEWVDRLAQTLPLTVMQALLGLRQDDQFIQIDEKQFQEAANCLARFIGHPILDEQLVVEAQTALEQMLTMLTPFVDERRAYLTAHQQDKSNHLIDHLLRAELAGDIETSEMALIQIAMLLFAGYETTRHLLSQGFYTLLQMPSVWKSCGENPESVVNIVRELLRFDSPVQYTARRVSVGFELHGKQFRRGDLVVPLIGAAHRDPKYYTDPNQFNPQRRPKRNLAFGMGAHVCIGTALTSMEAEKVFVSASQRWPNLCFSQAQATQSTMPLYRGLQSLKISRPL